jgi:Neuraminidase (sialidase)
MEDGTLVAAASGLRGGHICPWGKTVLFWSRDEGKTWSPPRVVNDTPLDDRDAGIASLGGSRLLLTWFASDVRKYRETNWGQDSEFAEQWAKACSQLDDDVVKKWAGSWSRLSEDGGGAWGDFIRVPVNAPHGPTRLRNGEVLYFGKCWLNDQDPGPIRAVKSTNKGRTWQDLAVVPIPAGSKHANFCEPHAVELSPGHLLGLVRSESVNDDFVDFHMYQTESIDGGKSWSTLHSTGIYGSPPHLIRHSTGKVICTYGYRRSPYGIRAMISDDEGLTWDPDWIIRDDGPDGDVGYPSTVELADGSLFTVCYQKVPGDKKCSLLWSRWRLMG